MSSAFAESMVIKRLRSFFVASALELLFKLVRDVKMEIRFLKVLRGQGFGLFPTCYISVVLIMISSGCEFSRTLVRITIQERRHSPQGDRKRVLLFYEFLP